MRYFDFHSHIVFKQIFDEQPNIDSRISSSDVAGVPRLCSDLPRIISTQIHQSQLSEFSDEVIIGVVLYGLESYLAKEVKPLRPFLKPASRHKLSEALLDDAASEIYKTFTKFTMERTLLPYLNAPLSFSVLKKSSFNNPLPKNKVNIFFVVEGCHSLVDSSNRYEPPKFFFPVKEILSNLDKLLEKAKVLSVNPTHLQQSNLCNHAFAIQLTENGPFIPKGNGMQEDGRKVVQGIFDRGICVDLKHMSYKSRKDLLDDIDAGKMKNVQPVLCTHAGFTGVTFFDWPGYISLKKPASGQLYLEIAKTMQNRNNPQRPGRPAFNMSTINLFDEEIAWIVDNGGVIGLSMDRRILGYVDKFDDEPTGIRQGMDLIVDKEFFSKDEWTSLNISNSRIGKLITEGDCVTMDDLDENTQGSLPARNEYFLDHILLHLKHYFQACINAGITIEKASKHITIGSDFDGLINPFLNLVKVQDMTSLKKYITMNFKFYLDSLDDSKLWSSQLNVPAFVEDLFYNNGFNFVKSRF